MRRSCRGCGQPRSMVTTPRARDRYRSLVLTATSIVTVSAATAVGWLAGVTAQQAAGTAPAAPSPRAATRPMPGPRPARARARAAAARVGRRSGAWSSASSGASGRIAPTSPCVTCGPLPPPTPVPAAWSAPAEAGRDPRPRRPRRRSGARGRSRPRREHRRHRNRLHRPRRRLPSSRPRLPGAQLGILTMPHDDLRCTRHRRGGGRREGRGHLDRRAPRPPHPAARGRDLQPFPRQTPTSAA